LRHKAPVTYEEELKLQRVLVRVAIASIFTSLIFTFVIVLYLFPDASLPSDLDPFTMFMANLLVGSILSVLASLIIAPAAIIGEGLFLWLGLKFGVNLLAAGLVLHFIMGVLFLGHPFMPGFIMLPLIIVSALQLSLVMKARACL
jgi:hypothetical protein